MDDLEQKLKEEAMLINALSWVPPESVNALSEEIIEINEEKSDTKDNM